MSIANRKAELQKFIEASKLSAETIFSESGKLAAQLLSAIEALEMISKSPTWGAKNTDGSGTSHTYKASTVGIAREFLNKLGKGNEK